MDLAADDLFEDYADQGKLPPIGLLIPSRSRLQQTCK